MKKDRMAELTSKDSASEHKCLLTTRDFNSARALSICVELKALRICGELRRAARGRTCGQWNRGGGFLTEPRARVAAPYKTLQYNLTLTVSKYLYSCKKYPVCHMHATVKPPYLAVFGMKNMGRENREIRGAARLGGRGRAHDARAIFKNFLVCDRPW